MKKNFLFSLLFTGMALFASGMELVTNGTSSYTIVLPEKPTAVEETAAKELQNYLKKISGALLPVVRTPEFKGNSIRLGQSPENARLLGIDFSGLKPDEIILKKTGNDLILTGDSTRGVLYAVYEFLEDLGVRRWTRWDTDIPVRKTILLKNYDIRYAPPFAGRDRLGGPVGEFAAWMRVNGHYLGIPESYGGILKLVGWCHTFGMMIPRQQYFEKHPEYFALVNGRRGPWFPSCGEVQLCLTNPDVLRLLTEKTLAWLRKEKNPRIISVSQNDSWGKMADNYCRCSNCRAIDEREGSPAGSLLHAVNQIADAVKKEFPQVLVETLAYQYTVKPPKTIRPRDNVIIRYCTRKNALYPIASQENARTREEIKAWSKAADKLYIWDYTSNFSNTMMPYPSWRPFAENLRFLAENHAVSVLEQGYSCGEAGDLIPVQNYLLCKLMWNPYQDQEKLTGEVLEGYYGAAAPELRKYMDISWEIYRKNQLAVKTAARNNAFGDMVASRVLSKLPLADLLVLRNCFDRAEELVKNDAEKLRRVRIAAMAVNFPILYSDEAYYKNAEKPEGRALREKINLVKLAKKTRKTVESLHRPDRYKEAAEASLERYIGSAEKYITGDWNKGRKVPPEFAGIAGDDLRIYGQEDFSLFSSKAGENLGYPVIKVGKSKGWKVHFSFDASHHLENSEWQVLIGLKTRFKGKPGGMVAADVTSTHFPARWIKLSEIMGDQFKYLDLGRHRLDGRHGYIALSASGVEQQLEMQYLILIRNGNYPNTEVPDICRNLNPEDYRIISSGKFNFWDNENRRSGHAVVVRSGKNSSLQCPLPALRGNWKIYLDMRADGPISGNAAEVWSKNGGCRRRIYKLNEIGGNTYKAVEFGTADLSAPGLLTFSRLHPAAALHVRNVILVRQ